MIPPNFKGLNIKDCFVRMLTIRISENEVNHVKYMTQQLVEFAPIIEEESQDEGIKEYKFLEILLDLPIAFKFDRQSHSKVEFGAVNKDFKGEHGFTFDPWNSDFILERRTRAVLADRTIASHKGVNLDNCISKRCS